MLHLPVMNIRRRLLAIFLLLSCLGKPVLAAEDCTTLLTGRCETCHYLTRVCDKVGENKGKWFWKRTVKNMVMLGAKLNPAEQEALLNCLHEATPEVLLVCGSRR